MFPELKLIKPPFPNPDYNCTDVYPKCYEWAKKGNAITTPNGCQVYLFITIPNLPYFTIYSSFSPFMQSMQ